MYRFPTQPRFPDLTKDKSNPSTVYAPPSALNSRATSLGFGQRAEITLYSHKYVEKTYHPHLASINYLLNSKKVPKKEFPYARDVAIASQCQYFTKAQIQLQGHIKLLKEI